MENVVTSPKEEWLKDYAKESSINKNSKHLDRFCEWAKVSDIELVEEYKTSDPREFAKKWGRKIVEFYNHALSEGYKSNYARTLTIAPRAFFKSQCVEVKIKRGAIAKAKIAMGEHEFLLEELQRMFRIGNMEDKARLATAISLGWGAQDFVRLEWSFIEPHLNENLEAPVAFWKERIKSGSPSRAHLTHEAIESLRELRKLKPKDKYVFTGYNGSHLTEDGLNAWFKSLVDRAKIETRGKIRFHLLRKFLLSQLSSSGMNQWEAKLCVGKSIPSDILTYLKDLTEDLRTKFMNATPRFTLTGFSNANHSKIDMIDEEVQELKDAIAKQQVEMKDRDIKIDALTESLTKALEEVKLLKAVIKKLPKLYRKSED